MGRPLKNSKPEAAYTQTWANPYRRKKEIKSRWTVPLGNRKTKNGKSWPKRGEHKPTEMMGKPTGKTDILAIVLSDP
jgi:hypothetical protein